MCVLGKEKYKGKMCRRVRGKNDACAKEEGNIRRKEEKQRARKGKKGGNVGNKMSNKEKFA